MESPQDVSLSPAVSEEQAKLLRTNEALREQILERIKAERALRLAERKYRGFFENAVEGVYQSTVNGRYLSVNPSLARLYGYASPAEMMERVSNIALDVYLEPRMREVFQEKIARDGEVRDLEYQVRGRDGHILWISENARAARNRAGKVLYYEGTIRDITRLKEAEAEAARLEEQLRHAQRIEAIGTLASGIAHDFNNILGAIMGFTELAIEDAPPGSMGHDNLQEVMAAARRARDLVRRILTFSRQSAPARTSLALGAVVQEAARMLQATLPAGVEFKLEILTAEDRIVGDPSQIHQVVINLCTNASHAMRERGRLVVRLEPVQIPVEETPAGRLAPGHYLLLSVSDTGEGIPPELKDRIFEPFFTTKPAGKGTGLGLSVVHGIVKSHGGDIQVASTLGQGSTFTVFLPAEFRPPSA